ncbi:hypothetical protein [Candidatus Nitrosotenuis uzonensis]|uniref:Multitransmembrane protein n=1 Tax=Candidatus Nitrosotenuis uzonensis TaxID=1407055 RepID=V6AS17_9ARCH|nr:hypothetical protein [Candidatus Nitrosotenuis uzonensis]CDI05330.1 putative Multitransmembrane protein [Candidatus Nitrosotenuis uzonensis]
MSAPNTLFFANRAKVGCVSGLVGGFAIFVSIFVIDLSMGSSPGTFYKVVGLPLGISGLGATLVGMVSHMLTAALIGTVFGLGSCLGKIMEISSLKKGAFAGAVTGIVVFLVFFVPITTLLMIPQIEGGGFSAEADAIVLNVELVMIGSLELHIVYGIVMGVFFAIAMQHQTKRQMLFQGA